MLLQNLKVPNTKFAIGSKVVSTDAKGFIEVEGKEIIDALLASGFVAVHSAKPVESPKQVAPQAEEAPKAAEQEKPQESEKKKARTFKRGG